MEEDIEEWPYKKYPYRVQVYRNDWSEEISIFFRDYKKDGGQWFATGGLSIYSYYFAQEEDALMFKLRFKCV